MRSTEWSQNILLVSSDTGIGLELGNTVGSESRIICAANGKDALLKLEDNIPFKVIIIDEKSLSENCDEFGKKSIPISIEEIVQYAVQLHDRPKVILIVDKMSLPSGDFAKKSGASLVLDRKNLNYSTIIFFIRLLRNRTFRTVICRDFREGMQVPCNLYHYVKMSNKYLILLRESQIITSSMLEKIKTLHVGHLYAQEVDFNKITRPNSSAKFKLTIKLNEVRKMYRNSLIDLFDISTDGKMSCGIEFMKQANIISNEIISLVDHFTCPQEALFNLIYPRWSSIAHAINTSICLAIFAKFCKLEISLKDSLIGSLYRNIGMAEINQEVLKKSELDMSLEEKSIYAEHVDLSIKILKRNRIVVTEIMEKILAYHHYNFDGTGFPVLKTIKELPDEVALVSIAGSYDYFYSMRAGQVKGEVSHNLSWEKLKEYHGGAKFRLELIQKIDLLFEES